MASGAGNVVAHNGSGIVVEGATATGNALLRNSLHDNTGGSGLGIDLGSSDGVTANDAGDTDTGPNDLQNFPVVSSAEVDDSVTNVTGTLASRPVMTYRIEFFSSPACDSSGHGEGETFLDFTNVATDALGNASFSVSLPQAIPLGHSLTATATSPSNATSESSACMTVTACAPQVFGQTILAATPDTLVWTNPVDLRWAKGPLTNVATYSITGTGLLFAASSLDTSGDNPGPGDGIYYLVRLQTCGSWQSSLGAESGRDLALP
jgi:hypothetical protein